MPTKEHYQLAFIFIWSDFGIITAWNECILPNAPANESTPESPIDYKSHYPGKINQVIKREKAKAKI